MLLRVYNTLTRTKEEFRTVEPGKVGMYVCGPTVYKPSHIGHMVGPVIFDTVKRYLTYCGYAVTWVVNITDVDDKLIIRARELNTTVKELAERMTADYVESLRLLNVTSIDKMPRATEHIPGMIEMIGGLIAKGFAYAAAGDVYFDISHDSDYGKLCNRDPEQLEAGSRVEVSDKKRNPGDFALWKGAKPGEPQWESPWGPGRPGWHIECSAMSARILGKTLDIHGGGLDLQFPHHENELAQSESFNDAPFARYWMHNGLLQMGKSKMAGSVGNVVNIVDLLQKHQPETVRFLLLSTHYRSPIEYSDEQLAEKARALAAFYRYFERYERIMGQSFYVPPDDVFEPPYGFAEKILPIWDRFFDCMNDDFNTGGALGTLFELLTALNKIADDGRLDSPNSKQADRDLLQYGTLELRWLSNILGLFWAPVSKNAASAELLGGLKQLLADVAPQAKHEDTADGMMQALIDLRNESRKAKNFAVADTIRKRLTALNITLEDRPGGKTDWRAG